MKKNNSPSVSLIVTTYNWKEALELVLRSIIGQTILPSEVIIADDGSRPDTAEMINEFQNKAPFSVLHVWQEDNGFQLSQIRNKAIAKASGEYILQIDGDVILEKHFVEDHLNFAKEGYFATGSRVGLTEEFSQSVLASQKIVFSPLSGGITNKFNAIRSSALAAYYRFRYKKNNPYYMKGCNMAYWKKDIIAVNGYNEEISGWGYEDNEIAARFLALGLEKQYLKCAGIVYHLYHNHNITTVNSAVLEETIASKTSYCAKGINQYL